MYNLLLSISKHGKKNDKISIYWHRTRNSVNLIHVMCSTVCCYIFFQDTVTYRMINNVNTNFWLDANTGVFYYIGSDIHEETDNIYVVSYLPFKCLVIF